MSAEVAASLHPPRLPETFVALTSADLVLAFGLGLALAALALLLMGPVLRRRTRRPSLRAEIGAARALPKGEALLGLAQIARSRGIQLTEAERHALYAPRGEGLDISLEALAERLKGRRA